MPPSRVVAPIQAGQGRPDKAFNLFPPGELPPDIAPPDPAIADEPLIPPTDWNSISPPGPMYPVPEEPTKGRGIPWWLDQLLLGGLGGAMMKANEVPNPNYHGPAGAPPAATPPAPAPAPAPAPEQTIPAPASPLPSNLAPPPEVAQPLFRRRQRQFGGGGGMVGPR